MPSNTKDTKELLTSRAKAINDAAAVLSDLFTEYETNPYYSLDDLAEVVDDEKFIAAIEVFDEALKSHHNHRALNFEDFEDAYSQMIRKVKINQEDLEANLSQGFLAYMLSGKEGGSRPLPPPQSVSIFSSPASEVQEWQPGNPFIYPRTTEALDDIQTILLHKSEQEGRDLNSEDGLTKGEFNIKRKGQGQYSVNIRGFEFDVTRKGPKSPFEVASTSDVAEVEQELEARIEIETNPFGEYNSHLELGGKPFSQPMPEDDGEMGIVEEALSKTFVPDSDDSTSVGRACQMVAKLDAHEFFFNEAGEFEDSKGDSNIKKDRSTGIFSVKIGTVNFSVEIADGGFFVTGSSTLENDLNLTGIRDVPRIILGPSAPESSVAISSLGPAFSGDDPEKSPSK